MKIVSVYRIDKNNIGDMLSTPKIYFDFLKDAEVVDNVDVCKRDHSDMMNANFVVVGGGGCVDLQYFVKKGLFNKVQKGQPKAMVAWGVGTNIHLNQQQYEDRTRPMFGLLDMFDLVGCRDWGSGYHWVPCVSCMNKVFDKMKDKKPTTKMVLYSHSVFGKEIGLDIPRMDNSARRMTEVLDFLASGETVLTSSYHGAYWATLLGRKVVVVHPFSTKFFYMRHKPELFFGGDLELSISRAKAYPEAIVECRKANVAFARNVQRLMEKVS